MSLWIVDARTFSSRPTGVGLYAFRLVKQLIADGTGRFVLLSDVRESRELQELERLGCEVRTYGRRVFKSSSVIRYFAWMKRQVAGVRPDVFWEPNNLLPFRPKGVGRVIVTMHDVFGLGWSRPHWLWHLYYRFSFWRTLRNVTEIWYNSAVTKGQVESYVASHGSHCLCTLPSSCKITHPIAEVPPNESIAPWPRPRPYFLYVGNVECRKGADLLFEAYRQYRATFRLSENKTSTVRLHLNPSPSPCDLLIAGLERNVKVPDAPGFVKLGYVDDATKFSLMKSCAALVVPSRDEGYGMQLAEALKLGVRVIASDVPAFEEVVAEQGSPSRNVIWLGGFVSQTDPERISALKSSLSAVGGEGNRPERPEKGTVDNERLDRQSV